MLVRCQMRRISLQFNLLGSANTRSVCRKPRELNIKPRIQHHIRSNDSKGVDSVETDSLHGFIVNAPFESKIISVGWLACLIPSCFPASRHEIAIWQLKF